MTNSSFTKNIANFVYEHMAKTPGNMLLITGTLGWALSSFAQITGIIGNKKLSSDDKKFLIPQEAFDAAVNIASFFLVTKAFNRLGEKLVDTGRLLTPSLKKELGEKISEIGKKDFSISKLDKFSNNENKTLFNKEASEKYFNFYDGTSFAFSTIGSIISGSIITPIFRNKMAAKRQKQAIAKENIQNQNNNIAPYKPVMPMQNGLSINAYQTKLSPSSGSMKI